VRIDEELMEIWLNEVCDRRPETKIKTRDQETTTTSAAAAPLTKDHTLQPQDIK